MNKTISFQNWQINQRSIQKELQQKQQKTQKEQQEAKQVQEKYCKTQSDETKIYEPFIELSESYSSLCINFDQEQMIQKTKPIPIEKNKITKVKTFQCPDCETIYKWNSSLRKHGRLEHNWPKLQFGKKNTKKFS